MIPNDSFTIFPDHPFKAEFSQTTRGRDQLIFCGQPFIYEKGITLPNGNYKKLWRCNQWWNKKCRARVFTIDDTVTPLNKYHTHEDIIRRKKRVSRKTKLAEYIEVQKVGDFVSIVHSSEPNDIKAEQITLI